MAPVAYVQGYQPFAFADFSGGLNLRDKADTVGDKEAIDLLNVTFTERGAIRQRDGYADLTSSDLTNRVDSLAAFYTAGGLKQLVAGCGTRLEALDSSGAVVASATGLTSGPYDFARFGDPGTEIIYAANGVDLMRRWNGSAWSTPTGTVNGTGSASLPKPGSIAVTATVPGTTSGSNAANRLIATGFGTATNGGPGGLATNPSRWFASNPGAPTVWETDGTSGRARNFGDLTPGDGEQIMGAATWRELVFIFKETKFFILWGESTGSDGNPIFNFREVVNSVGLSARNAFCVGRDGVYFMNRRGIYHTSGGDPTLLSDKIGPLWSGDLDVYYQGSQINMAELALARMWWFDEQLYVAVPTGIQTYNDRLLVYDTQHQWWSIYDMPASAGTAFRIGDQEEIVFGLATGDKRVERHRVGLRDDRGVNMTSRWRSGWSNYDNPVQKTIRENKGWGSGVCWVSFSIDFNLAQTETIDAAFSLSDTWPDGTEAWADWIAGNQSLWPGGNAVSARMLRRAVRGTSFSTQFSNHPLSKDWSMHQFVRHLRETREPSIR